MLDTRIILTTYKNDEQTKTELFDFEKLTIVKRLHTMAHYFSFVLLDKNSIKETNLMDNNYKNEVEVFLGDKKIITAYIEQINYGFDEKVKKMEVIGRSKTADLIDSSNDKEVQYASTTVRKVIGNLIKGFNIKLKKGSIDAKLNRFFVKRGETFASSINRALDLNNYFLVCDEDSNIQIESFDYNEAIKEDFTKPSSGKIHSYILKSEGASKTVPSLFENDILRAYIKIDNTKVYSKYSIYNTQGHSGDVVVDNARPNRILIEPRDNLKDNSHATEQATAVAVASVFEHQEIHCKVNGWLNEHDELWNINQYVNVHLSQLAMSPTIMIVKAVTFYRSPDNFFTSLVLGVPLPKIKQEVK